MFDKTYKIGELTQIISKHSKSKKADENPKERKKLEALFSPAIKKEYEVGNIFNKLKKENVVTAQENSERKTHKRVKKEQVTDVQLKSPKKTKKRKIDKTAEEAIQKSPKVARIKMEETVTKEGKDQKTKKRKKKLSDENEDRKEEKDVTIEGDKEEKKPSDREEQRKNRKKFKKKKDVELESRTLFVGNLPVTYDKRQMKRLFIKCGQIESVRFRRPPPADPRIPKKVVSIMKDFHPERPSSIGYVCFKEEKSVKNALKLNGLEVEGFHLRVDLASRDKEHNNKCSVFVGNLPFAMNEEPVRKHFEDCGKIVNIRIIRDRRTGLGKGFCYVTFETKDAVGFALGLNGKELDGRELRVHSCQENHKPNKKKTKSTPSWKIGEKRRKMMRPSNDTTKSFQGMKAQVNKKQLKKKKDKVKRKSRNKFNKKFTDKMTVNLEKKNKPLKNRKTNKKGKQR